MVGGDARVSLAVSKGCLTPPLSSPPFVAEYPRMPHSWILGEPNFFGLKAPGFIWFASAFLVVWAGVTAAWLWWRVRARVRPMQAATRRLRDLGARDRRESGGGLAERQYEQVRQALGGNAAAELWTAIAGRLVRRRSRDGEDEYWMPESAGDWVAAAAPEKAQFNRGYFAAFPGLLTGCGLFLTFLAILFALKDVTVDQAMQQVQHVDKLINGLSGKFLSSVVALLLAILFTLWERRLAHVLERAEARVKAAVEALFPRLTSVYLLSEMQQGTGDQIREFFREFGTDLATRFRAGVDESVGPTLHRMVEVIEKLSADLRAAEAARQEMVTGSVERMMRDLSGSVSTALERMTGEFGKALAGGTSAQFDRLAGTVTQAAELVSGLGGQLAAIRESAQREAEAAGERERQLQDLVARIAGKLEESASAAVAGAADSAQRIIQNAGEWSAGAQAALGQLLDQQSVLLREIRAGADGLIGAENQFRTRMKEYADLSGTLGRIVAEAGAFARAAADAAASAQEAHAALQGFVRNSDRWLEGAQAARDAQETTWSNIHSSMERYRAVFAEAEAHTAKLVSQLQGAAVGQFESTRGNYDKLMQAFDDHFSGAVEKLGGAIRELGENLDDLGERVAAARGGRG